MAYINDRYTCYGCLGFKGISWLYDDRSYTRISIQKFWNRGPSLHLDVSGISNCTIHTVIAGLIAWRDGTDLLMALPMLTEEQHNFLKGEA